MKTLALILVAMTISAQAQTIPAWAYDAFSKWMVKYGTTFDSPSEQEYRAGVFYNNLLYIQTTNAAQSDYTLGANQFAALTTEEFLEMYTGYDTTITKIPGIQKILTSSLESLPASVDWVAAGAVTPIKNQGQCGDCWAFSAVAATEGIYQITSGNLTSFSEQQVTDCSSSFGNMGCNGGLMDNAFQYFEQYGIQTEASYPFVGVTEKCKYNAADVVTKISNYTDVPPKENYQLRLASIQQPVSIAIDAENIMLYVSGIFSNKNCGTQLDHGVTLVGYGTDNGTDYWTVKNSWGTSWGEAGYIRFLRHEGAGTAICCLNCDASYPSI